MASIIVLFLLLFFPSLETQVNKLFTEVKIPENKVVVYNLSPTPLPTPIKPTIVVKKNIKKINDVNKDPAVSNKKDQEDSWGVSKQISEHTWTMKVGNDQEMAGSQEIMNALNNYRNVHGKGILSWNDGLASFAKSRAEQFNKDGKLDEHAGFNSYFGDPENIRKTGFMKVGENSSVGYKMDGVHIIEWVFAGDAPHDNNQLDLSWSAVGIGVSGAAVDIIFGGN
ncbi:MAG TPA: CAP domain-containing protein [Patescibacteria group bacterium]|nr:CAP domain-containing protein [Patescibacteria group bacterium]